MNQDVLNITILDDGTVKIESPGSVSGANHSTADAAFRFLADNLGGETTKERLPQKHQHNHSQRHVRQ